MFSANAAPSVRVLGSGAGYSTGVKTATEQKPTAVKTGTAQVKIANEDKYKHIGWMIGFSPVKNPRIAFCVEIEQDQAGNDFWGGQMCAPIAQSVLNYYFRKL